MARSDQGPSGASPPPRGKWPGAALSPVHVFTGEAGAGDDGFHALEALIAAIYLDRKEKEGVEGIRRVIWKIFSGRIEEAEKTLGGTDFKTELQEMVQKRYKDTVRYQIIKEEGPDHEKIFEAAVIFQDKEYGRGSGRSKKLAEQDAAENALREFQ